MKKTYTGFQKKSSKGVYSEKVWDVLNYCKTTKTSPWISATNTKNYVINDSVLDWLDLYFLKLGFNVSVLSGNEMSFLKSKLNNPSTYDQLEQSLKKTHDENLIYLNMLFQKGFEFEDKVFKKLQNDYAKEFITINMTGPVGRTRDNFNATKEAVLSGVPIISQAVLFNDNNNTFGTADLLVRSDYINKLCREHALTNDEINIKAKKLKKYHYRVIDIKWSTLPFYSKQKTIRKDGFMSAYKSQLAIYNCAIGNIQGYFPEKTYLLGKGWNHTVSGQKEKIFDCFDRLGVVDYHKSDNEYIQKTVDAIMWYRNVKEFGHLWSPLESPESKNVNLFPNMSNVDLKWNHIKKEIASLTGEPTQICYVGTKERQALHDKGIYYVWDSKFNSQNMELKGIFNSEKIDTICEVNRNKTYNILPTNVQNNDNFWQKSYSTDMFFDYETVNTDFIDKDIDIHNSKSEIMIFMIGVGYIQNGIWKYEVMHMKDINNSEEESLMDKFTKFVSKKSLELDPEQKYQTRLFHWSHAEVTNFRKTNEKYNDKWSKWEKSIKYVDMYKIFNDEKIGIKGSYNYSLKSIGNALYNLKYINTVWPNNSIANGQIALFASAKYYHNKATNNLSQEDKKIIDNIVKYNEIDCKMIWEIVSFFRK